MKITYKNWGYASYVVRQIRNHPWKLTNIPAYLCIRVNKNPTIITIRQSKLISIFDPYALLQSEKGVLRRTQNEGFYEKF